MPRERQYRSNAERQAAYRARHAEREPVRQARMALIGQELHGRLRQAIEAGTNRVPAAVLGKRADETLINLMAYVTRGVLLNAPPPSGPEGEGRGGSATGEEGAEERCRGSLRRQGETGRSGHGKGSNGMKT